ncbi:MAG: T9SS type A sorting domain-containing protein, partial [candidate division Zixibacteria bacterium]|nr:T9SS type A sorting domain-containing protein [candidate division Zixibacteria bacterium]
IAASDVNADGLTLSVADLVYLIRVVIGDALPYAKIAPAAINFTVDAGMVNVESAMGAAYVVVEGDATPTLLVDNMEMRYAYDADINATRVLVYSMEEGATFDGTFLNANGTVVSAEFATYEGAPVTAKLVPTAYSLSQNYPNPFNPTTNIAFDLPQTSDYSLRVFNVTGQKVAEFAGSSEAGTVVIEWDAQDQASGIYFYKLAAGNFTATKKMVLLK